MTGTSTDAPPADQPRVQYIRGLDALRLLAVTIVMLAHFRVSEALPGGFGVTIFFAISGFLICRLLLAEELARGNISLKGFFSRRFLRLMPPLLLMLAVTAPIYYLSEPQSFNPLQIVLAIFYLGNVPVIVESLGGPAMNGVHGYGVLWSLAVEEHFYLLFPFALLAIRSNEGRIRLILAVIAGSLILRILFALTLVNADDVNYYFTLTRFDSIAWGCLLTLLLAGSGSAAAVIRQMRGIGWLVAAGAVLLAGIAFRNDFFQDTLRYTVHGIGMFMLLNAFVFGQGFPGLMRLAEWSPVRLGGRISYEIYLWHMHIYHFAERLIENYPVRLGVSILVTLLVSYVSYVAATAFSRWVKSRSALPPSPAAAERPAAVP